jgi:hypothetical protein
MMTLEQEKHIADIIDDFSTLADRKYRKGQQEHGGDLFNMSTIKLLDNAIDEAIDQVIYLLTIKRNIKLIGWKK